MPFCYILCQSLILVCVLLLQTQCRNLLAAMNRSIGSSNNDTNLKLTIIANIALWNLFHNKTNMKKYFDSCGGHMPAAPALTQLTPVALIHGIICRSHRCLRFFMNRSWPTIYRLNKTWDFIWDHSLSHWNWAHKPFLEWAAFIGTISVPVVQWRHFIINQPIKFNNWSLNCNNFNSRHD